LGYHWTIFIYLKYKTILQNQNMTNIVLYAQYIVLFLSGKTNDVGNSG